VTHEEKNGSVFVRRLRELTGLTPFNCRDPQEIRGLKQEQFACRVPKKSYVLFEIIRECTAKSAAEMPREQQHKRQNRLETALAWMNSGSVPAMIRMSENALH
jgi:hypothetical protein